MFCCHYAWKDFKAFIYKMFNSLFVVFFTRFFQKFDFIT